MPTSKSCASAVKKKRPPEVFFKKGPLKNFAKFAGKNKNGQSLFFNKVADLRPATLIKKKLRQACFLVNISKFLRTPFFKEHLQ